MRAPVTDRFKRNRHALRLNIDVTVACMNNLDAAARYLRDLLPDMAGELEPWTSSKARTLPHFLASLFGLAEIDLLGNRVLLANVMTKVSVAASIAPPPQLNPPSYPG